MTTRDTPKWIVLLVTPLRSTEAVWTQAVPSYYKVIYAPSLLTGRQQFDEHMDALALVVVADRLFGGAPADPLLDHIQNSPYNEKLVVEDTSAPRAKVAEGHHHRTSILSVPPLISTLLAA